MISSRLYPVARLAAAVAGLVALTAAADAGAGIDVVMNQAKIVKLARPADTVVVGNPLIADASVKDAETLVLTGKGFGVTNLVVLDQDGLPIVDEEIFVRRNEDRTVRIYRRSDMQTLSCSPTCEAAFKSEAEAESDSAVAGN